MNALMGWGVRPGMDGAISLRVGSVQLKKSHISDSDTPACHIPYRNSVQTHVRARVRKGTRPHTSACARARTRAHTHTPTHPPTHTHTHNCRLGPRTPSRLQRQNRSGAVGIRADPGGCARARVWMGERVGGIVRESGQSSERASEKMMCVRTCGRVCVSITSPNIIVVAHMPM